MVRHNNVDEDCYEKGNYRLTARDHYVIREHTPLFQPTPQQFNGEVETDGEVGTKRVSSKDSQ